MAAGACAPIACAGINNPRGALTGYPPEPPVRISEAEGWLKSVEILLVGTGFAFWIRPASLTRRKKPIWRTGVSCFRRGRRYGQVRDSSFFDLTPGAAGWPQMRVCPSIAR